jgi:hypothetical protein
MVRRYPLAGKFGRSLLPTGTHLQTYNMNAIASIASNASNAFDATLPWPPRNQLTEAQAVTALVALVKTHGQDVKRMRVDHMLSALGPWGPRIVDVWHLMVQMRPGAALDLRRRSGAGGRFVWNVVVEVKRVLRHHFNMLYCDNVRKRTLMGPHTIMKLAVGLADDVHALDAWNEFRTLQKGELITLLFSVGLGSRVADEIARSLRRTSSTSVDECPICYETTTVWQSVSCRHSICPDCLDKYVAVLRSQGVRDVPCCLCRQPMHFVAKK